MKRTVRQAGVNKRDRNQRIKPRNRRKPNIKLLLSMFVASACVGCVSSYALQTPALAVREVEVRGIHCADKAQVQQAARAVLGKNIIMLRKGPVVRCIDAVHEVEDVQMGRTLPGKVWISIEERKPGAVLVCGGKCFLLQDDGLVFHCLAKARPQEYARARGVPLLIAADCRCVKLGATCSAPGVQCALSITRIARERRLEVAKISVDRLGDICLNMGSGFYVKLGQPDELEKKMSLLRDALAYKPSLAREAAYIDLSCPTAPVWKPKQAAGAAS